MTYIRKGLTASPFHINNQEHPDISGCLLRTPRTTPVYIINIYNAEQASKRHNEAARVVQHWRPPQNLILCGDLNLHNSKWDELVSRNQKDSEEFSDWLDTYSLSIDNDRHTPTRAQSVIELANVSPHLRRHRATRAAVDYDHNKDCGSDHLPIRTTISSAKPPPGKGKIGAYKLDSMDEGKFADWCINAKQGLICRWNVPVNDRPAEVARLASALQNIVSDALEQSTPRSSGKGSEQPWWPGECDEAAKDARETCRR